MSEQLFNWFDPRQAVRVYRGNLPHWRQAGGLYFVTFRLADSIPKLVLNQWDSERRAWLEAHGILGYPVLPTWRQEFGRLSEDKRRMFERMNAKRLFTELDRCLGACCLRNGDVRDILTQAMLHFDGSRWRLGDYVVMPNHVHMLVSMAGEHELEDVLYSVKRFSARRINAALSTRGRIWQKEYYDHLVRDAAELFRIRKYIVENPQKVGIGTGEYAYFRAEWLDDIAAG